MPYAPEGEQYEGEFRRWLSYFQPSEPAGLLSSVGFHVRHEETIERSEPWWRAVLATVQDAPPSGSRFRP